MAEERLEEIRKLRLEKRQQLLDEGSVPYPSEVRRTHTLHQATAEFDTLLQDSTPVALVGRVSSLRRHGAIVFLDLTDAAGSFQLQLTQEHLPEESFARLELLDAGDWLQAAGTMTRTKRDLPALQVAQWHIVSKSIRPLPSTWFGLKNQETRYREREIDLLLNEDVKKVFVTRSRVVHWLREYMSLNGYLEMTTPVLEHLAGGAAAKPFVTHHNALDMDLYLRIATEIPLKRLLVAGFEKVFEIGPRFRNEGIDRQHNPEFTMLESQWAFADYEDLMEFTETCLEQMTQDLTGGTTIEWQGQQLAFAKPFARVRYVDIVSHEIGFNVLEEKDPARYVGVFNQRGLSLPEAQTYYQLVDEFYKKVIRPQLTQPTLVYDYPIEMAPLAKPSAHDPRVAEKFQTLVAGVELNNCYTELNDPVMQRQVLEEQLKNRAAGDEEAHQIDEAYLRSMEYGMPPNAGWSLGIDRLVMMLSNQPSIRDVILFPLLRPENTDL